MEQPARGPGGIEVNYLALGIFVAMVFGLSVSECSHRKPAPSAAELEAARAAKRAEDEARSAQAAEERRLGYHCRMTFDGSSPQFVGLVKDALRDPGSFEHDTTWTMPVGKDGRHYIKMIFRSRNGFGGMDVAEAIGSLDPKTCDARLTKVTQYK